MTDTPIVLQAKGITKQFPGVLANDNVNFDLRKGEIHALLGENGAGKTTLMNILYGLYKPDAGEVSGQRPAAWNSTRPRMPSLTALAWCTSISCSSRSSLSPKISCWALKPTTAPAERDHPAARPAGTQNSRRNGQGALPKYGLDVDPEAIVGDLPVGVQQRVEIVKALYRKPTS